MEPRDYRGYIGVIKGLKGDQGLGFRVPSQDV